MEKRRGTKLYRVEEEKGPDGPDVRKISWPQGGDAGE